MKRSPSNIIALGAAVLALQGCRDRAAPTESSGQRPLAASVAPPEPAGRYVVVFSAERVPADVGERVARLGGSVEASLESIGVAVVSGLTPEAAAELATQADIRNLEP